MRLSVCFSLLLRMANLKPAKPMAPRRAMMAMTVMTSMRVKAARRREEADDFMGFEVGVGWGGGGRPALISPGTW